MARSAAAGSYGDDGVTMVDYEGGSVDKSRTGGWTGALFILGTELAERFSVVGISGELVNYLIGTLHLSVASSAKIITSFVATLNLVSLAGGYLADAKLGRYRTIVLSAIVTALGICLLTVDATVPALWPPRCEDPGAQECVPASRAQLAVLYIALYTIAAGAGGVKANVSAFGSDQFDSREPREERAMVFYFTRFYLCISVGSLLAATVLIYVQDSLGRGWGYGTCAVAMLLSIAVIVGGRSKYRYRRPAGSPLSIVREVLWTAWHNRRLPLAANVRDLNGFSAANRTDRLRWLDKAAIVTGTTDVLTPTVTEVEEVKMILMIFPIWCTTILFGTIYSQMATFSIEQASYMDLHLHPGSDTGFTIPTGSVNVFLILSIITFTMLDYCVIQPVARRFTDHPNGLTSLQRAGGGLLLAILSMIVAAMVEKKRRDAATSEESTIITVFWLIPQFCLVGAGEAFAYVGQLEFYIREAPERMKSMSTGLFYASTSAGFYLSSFLVWVVNRATRGEWIKNNFNTGRLDLFYFMLAVLGAINFGVFILVARRHQYHRIRSPTIGVEEV